MRALKIMSADMEGFAAMSGIELVVIDGNTRLRQFKEMLRNNELYYHLAPGLGRI